jgi:mono/diheme cytochrome c family protein
MNLLTRLFPYLLSTVVLSSCTNNPGTTALNNLIGPDQLPAQTITIDPTRDTTLTTAKGAILRIPAGALEGTAAVQLQIKEAYTIEDMVRGGLFTSSKNGPLSSGGMIDIRPATGEKLKLKKPIGVAIPARPYRDNMQLYKGVEDGKGAIDWTEPQPLKDTSGKLRDLTLGKDLFMTNCASCHGIEKELTGPALAFIAQRRDRDWLFRYIRHDLRVADSIDMYSLCLFDWYHKNPMNTFPALTDADIDRLLLYISNESQRFDSTSIEDPKKKFDSCAVYYRAVGALLRRRDSLIEGNRKQVEVNWVDSNGIPIIGSHKLRTKTRPVGVVERPVIYYQFTIDTFGWYNIDLLVSGLDGVKESLLRVTVKGQYKAAINPVLVIPALKTFQRGGLLKDATDDYGFYTEDGRIPLPQGEEGYILVMGDYSGQVVFGKLRWTIGLHQDLTIEPTLTTKEKMNEEISHLPFGKLKIHADDSKNAAAIRQTDKEIQALDSLKPKGVDCGCGLVR